MPRWHRRAQGAKFPVWTFITDNYLQLLTANILISYALATYVYLRSFSVKPGNAELRELSVTGQTGNIIYDWFMGRELNPRVTIPLLGEIDIKVFMELRPGIMGWLLLNCAFIAKQHRTFGFVTDSIIFVAIAQAVYVIDSQIMETGILTMMDITMDGFGLMLSFGDLAWVPFVFSMPARYLSVHPVSLGWVEVMTMSGILLAGFSIFRLANTEKNIFRTSPNDPRVAHLKSIETSTGSRLLTSGWWGTARHINYLGDWIQCWSYCLPTGLAGYIILSLGTGAADAFTMADGREVISGAAKGWGMIFAYIYTIYLGVLLIHRDRRDEQKCAKKYGEAWDKYTNCEMADFARSLLIDTM